MIGIDNKGRLGKAGADRRGLLLFDFIKITYDILFSLFASQVIGALVYFSGVAVWLSKDHESPDAQIGWALIVGITGTQLLLTFPVNDF